MANFINNIFNKLPKMTVGDGNPEKWNKVADWISRPTQNRLIMGGTAIFIQPTIDRHNKHVNEETRETSALRTTAKVLVGTGVGIVVRQACYEITGMMTNVNGTKPYSKWLVPIAKLTGLKNDNPFLKTHRTVIATFMGLGVMLFTNFLIDAPATVKLTNKLLASSNTLKEIRAKKEEGGLVDVQV